MYKTVNSSTFAELAAKSVAPPWLIDVANDYAERRSCRVDQIAPIVGDQTKAVRMEKREPTGCTQSVSFCM